MQTNLYFVSFGPFSWPPYALRQTKQNKTSLQQNAFLLFFLSLRRRCAACSLSTLRLCPFVLYFHFGVHTRLLTRSFSLLLFTDAERFRSVTRCWLLSLRSFSHFLRIKRSFAMHFNSEFFLSVGNFYCLFHECWTRPCCEHQLFIANNNNHKKLKMMMNKTFAHRMQYRVRRGCVSFIILCL